MDNIIGLELKNSFRVKKVAVVALCILIGILFGVVFLKGVMTDRISKEKDVIMVKGNEAIELLKEYDQKTAGYVTPEKLSYARHIFNKSYDSKKDKLVITKSLLQEDNIISVINSLRFPLKDSMVVVPWNDATIPAAYAENFYDLRQSMIKQYTDQIQDKSIANKIWAMEEKVKKPFFIGTHYSVWSDSIEWLTILTIISLFVTMIHSAGVFTDTKENGLYDILSKTYCGHKQFGIAKISVALFFNTLIYIAMVFPYLVIIYLSLESEGLLSSIQVDMAFSPGNLIFRDAILFQLIGGYIAMLALSSLSMLISAWCQKTKHALTIMISLYSIYMLLTIFIRPSSKIIHYLLNFSPFGVSQVFFQLPIPDFLNVGVVIWLPIAMLICGMIQTVVFNVVAIYKMKRMRGA